MPGACDLVALDGALEERPEHVRTEALGGVHLGGGVVLGAGRVERELTPGRSEGLGPALRQVGGPDSRVVRQLVAGHGENVTKPLAWGTVSTNTQVIVVPEAERGPLRERLGQGAFEWRQPPHSEFGVKGEGVVVTLYRSGKLVVQGADPEAFLVRYGVQGDAPPGKGSSTKAAAEEGDAIAQTLVTTVGSDETGKGDYFGPLVVAAVRIEPEQAEGLSAEGVTDSKKVTDKSALRLGALIRGALPCAVVRLDPADYNARYAASKGLNPLLAELHAEAIGELAQPGMRVVIDKFAADSVMRKALGDMDVAMVQAARAERNAAVAAASIVARAEFLLAMDELGETVGAKLHKGAGAPVDKVGAQLVRDHGYDVLETVAKLHFKNTNKIMARLG